MTITGIQWAALPDPSAADRNLSHLAGRDIHLLPGFVSPRLDQLLVIFDDDGDKRADDPPEHVTVSFGADFEAAPASVGVTINENTGQIKIADALPPGPRLRSFIVTADVGDDNDANLSFSISIRVYVHERLVDMWLTPPALTVREESDVRFSVLATFDDGAVCDITNWSPLVTPGEGDLTFVHEDTADPVSVHTWNAVGSGVSVASDTGQISCTDPSGSAQISVSQNWSGAMVAGALAEGAPSWTAVAKTVTLHHISGPDITRLNEDGVRNLLFLPDGFVDAEQDDFTTLVTNIVTKLNTLHRTTPFDLFKDQFAYYTAWLPSRDAGVTVLPELDQVPWTGPNLQGDEVPLPVPPGPAPDALSRRQLIGTVGLPTPAYEPPTTTLGTDDNGLAHDWQILYGTENPTIARTSAVFASWLALDDRVLLNERDTAFALALGARPQIDGSTAEDRELRFHPFRTTIDDFDGFLGALEDGTGAAVTVWKAGGKDDALIVLIGRSSRVGGVNNPRGGRARYIGMTLANADYHHFAAAPHGFDVVPDAFTTTVSTDLWTKTAHELAHSFRIADEYAEGGSAHDALPANAADALETEMNVQARTALLVNGSLDVTAIKWRWPRIKRCGVLADDPVDTGGGFGPYQITLRSGHGKGFKIDDVIRLRDRTLLEANYSNRLQITSVSGDVLLAKLISADGKPISQFDDDSVVVLPYTDKPKPGQDIGDDLLLISPSTLARMHDTHNPLTANDGEPFDRPTPQKRFAVPTAATNFAGGTAPKPPIYSSWYVGLFENGSHFRSGVYRPTGICIMSSLHYTDPKVGERAYQFCPVCRYAIVDAVDPTKHTFIDKDFTPRYPKT